MEQKKGESIDVENTKRMLDISLLQQLREFEQEGYLSVEELKKKIDA